jgi:hypothetical protein
MGANKKAKKFLSGFLRKMDFDDLPLAASQLPVGKSYLDGADCHTWAFWMIFFTVFPLSALGSALVCYRWFGGSLLDPGTLFLVFLGGMCGGVVLWLLLFSVIYVPLKKIAWKNKIPEFMEMLRGNKQLFTELLAGEMLKRMEKKIKKIVVSVKRKPDGYAVVELLAFGIRLGNISSTGLSQNFREPAKTLWEAIAFLDKRFGGKFPQLTYEITAARTSVSMPIEEKVEKLLLTWKDNQDLLKEMGFASTYENISGYFVKKEAAEIEAIRGKVGMMA